MIKQLVVLFWGFIYGEVIGYIGAALTGATFSPLGDGLTAMVIGLILVNVLNLFIKDPTTSKR